MGRHDDHRDDQPPATGTHHGDQDGDEQGGAAEADLLRAELQRLAEALTQAVTTTDEAQDRYLRARADLENLRRRHQADLERAREQGFDGALQVVLRVHDDLSRALAAAQQGEPSAILPGVEAVLAGLLRDLGTMDVHRFGEPGEAFEPSRYEALAVVPADEHGRPGEVQSVFETGFVQGDRLVRPARVVVYQDD